MIEKKLQITFLSDWQVGSGLGDGHLADTVVSRDHDGLPVISGRALKGALREGAWRLALCREDLGPVETYLWGGRSDTRESTRTGRLRVGMGHLPEDMRQALIRCNKVERETYVGDMMCRRSLTALEPDRTIKSGSLRTLECGIPGVTFESILTLAETSGLDEKWLTDYFRSVCAAVKSMGAHRARGLGNCRILLAEDVKPGHEQVVELPPPYPLTAWEEDA